MVPVPAGLQKTWDEATQLLDDGDPDRALARLRENWSKDDEHPNTYVLAARAKIELAERASGQRTVHGLKKQAKKHVRDAVRLDQKHEGARTLLDQLQQEVPSRGLKSLGRWAPYSDGVPTPAGILLWLPLGFLAVLMLPALIDPISEFFSGESAQNGDRVRLLVEWTDDSGATRSGEIVLELYPDAAPIHVESFKDHVQNGTYDGTVFHRVIDAFMIQGGDFENGDGTGGHAAHFYGYCDGRQSTSCQNDATRWTLPDEKDNGLTHTPGALSMAKTSDPHTGGSQFFIVDEDASPSSLNDRHTVFGMTTSGLDHVNAITELDTDSNDRPHDPVTIVRATLE